MTTTPQTVHIITTEDNGEIIFIDAYFKREDAETEIRNIAAEHGEDLRDAIINEYTIHEILVK